METYDRYSMFRKGDEIDIVPFGEIPVKNTDKYETYKRGLTRLDMLSSQYYDNPNYGWLILQANPEYGSLEFRIPDGASLRIPYPLKPSLNDYQASIEKYKKLYA